MAKLKRRIKKFRGRKHSPEGEKYRTLGEGAYEAGRRKKLGLRRKIKAISKISDQ